MRTGGPAGPHNSTNNITSTSDNRPAPTAGRSGSRTRTAGGSPRRQRLKTNPPQRPDIPLQQRPGTVDYPGRVGRDYGPSKNGRGRRPGNGCGRHRSIIQFKGLPVTSRGGKEFLYPFFSFVLSTLLETLARPNPTDMLYTSRPTRSLHIYFFYFIFFIFYLFTIFLSRITHVYTFIGLSWFTYI